MSQPDYTTPPTAEKVLLLGMVYALPPTKNKNEIYGQECRDRIRCEEMAKRYEVYSLDDKHTEDCAITGKHCQANFADPRRMIFSMHETWKNEVCFDQIILDYFFLPAGWAAQRWTKKFFKDTLPTLVEWNILKPGGCLWLPHVSHTAQMVKEFQEELAERFIVDLIEDPQSNPLFAATEECEDLLIEASPKAILTNATQLPYLMQITKQPFFRLTAKVMMVDPLFSTPTTKSKKRAKMSPKMNTEALRAVKRKLA